MVIFFNIKQRLYDMCAKNNSNNYEHSNLLDNCTNLSDKFTTFIQTYISSSKTKIDTCTQKISVGNYSITANLELHVIGESYFITLTQNYSNLLFENEICLDVTEQISTSTQLTEENLSRIKQWLYTQLSQVYPTRLLQLSNKLDIDNHPIMSVLNGTERTTQRDIDYNDELYTLMCSKYEHCAEYEFTILKGFDTIMSVYLYKPACVDQFIKFVVNYINVVLLNKLNLS